MEISYFRSGEFSKVTGTVLLEDFFDYVQNGRWQDKVLDVRTGKVEKKFVPSVTVSGSFRDRRAKTNLSQHSGLIGIDLDADDNPGLLDKRTSLEQDAYCYACHVSIRGYGLVWYVKVSPEKHLEAFRAIERYLANEYNVVVDPSGKDVSRLRFVSYDPHLYKNEKSKKWHKVLNKAEREPVQATRPIAYHDKDMAHIMEQIQQRGINIAEDYHSWLNISFALAKEFDEQGRVYFHTVSSQSGKYDRQATDRQFNIALKRDHAGGIGIGTFFYYCKRAGVETRTRETLEIEAIFRQRRKSEPKLDPEEAIKSTVGYMEMKGVDSDRTRVTLDRVKDLPVNQFQVVKGNDKVLELEAFVGQYKLRFNEITRYVELEGKQMDDRDYFTIYRKAMHAIDYNLSKNKLFDLINSDLIPSYHPFKEFFESNKHLKPSGKVKEILSCIKYKKPELGPGATEDEVHTDYLDMFLHRWLLGVVSAMNGTYSLLTLVLCGPQGCGKSKFFRNLLPEVLQDYYAEGKMETDGDAKELMTKKLIVMDDEFGGKNKTNAVKFKEISSKDRFYVKKPYGKVWEDLKRYAVLCGTSNDSEILIDPTGNRRLIPVDVISIDHEKMSNIDKVELFMELYWDWKEFGNRWMLTKKDISYLNKATIKNEKHSFEEEMINKYFEPIENEGGNSVWLSASEIKVKIDARTGNRIYEGKIGQILGKLGFKSKQKRMRGRKTPGKYYLVIDHGSDTTTAPSINSGETKVAGDF